MALTTVAEVLAAADPVAITIDGKAVREVPGPTGLPFVGNYFEVYPDHLGNHQRLFEKYGPIFRTNNMGSVIYHTNDPRLANIVFAESDFFTKKLIEGHPLHPIKNKEAGVFLGDTDSPEWREIHKFLPPALGPKAVRHYAPTMQATVEDSFRAFDELDEKDEVWPAPTCSKIPILLWLHHSSRLSPGPANPPSLQAWNVYSYMLKLGSQAVGKLVLGLNFNHFTSATAPPHEMVIRIAQTLELNKKISAMGSWYAMLPFGPPQQLRVAKERIEHMMEESVANASKGIEDLELQDAAVTAENMVGKYHRAQRPACQLVNTGLTLILQLTPCPCPSTQTTYSAQQIARATRCPEVGSSSHSSWRRAPASQPPAHSCRG